MKKIYLSAVALFIGAVAINGQSFDDNSSLLLAEYNSGGCVGVCDMNNDGWDDVVILDLSYDLHIAYQQTNGTFVTAYFGQVSDESQWGMCIGDIDNDGHKDVICGGNYDNVHVVNIDGPEDYEQIELTWASIFYQGSCLGDVNNDGWLDAYICHDDGEGVILANNGSGAFTNGSAWINMDFSSTDDSGNYGSVFTDFDRDGDTDLFIAKCRQFISDPYDQRRTNKLLVNDGNNNYTEEADQRGLVNLQQSWTSDFVDLDNDGDFDCFLTTHSNTLEIYENDGTGNFTNATVGSGLEVSGFFLQAKWADFDNDGDSDLLHSGGNHGYFRNNGNMTFTSVDGTFPADDVMHSFGIGDLNHDGWLDVYASYGDGYVNADMDHNDILHMNEGGTNNFIVFDLEGTISNMDGANAIVEIHTPGGIQIREVRCGESYGITNTSMCHFGLGTNSTIDFALVFWPSGIVQVLNDLSANTWNEVIEQECTVTPTATIESAGNINLCPGESVTLNVVNADGTYQWNNGSQGSSIVVNQAGSYSVAVWNEDGCASLSNVIDVTMIQNTPASVTVEGDVSFCEGGSVLLVASPGSSFTWNGPLVSSSQSLMATESGNYSVSVTNACAGNSSTSEVIAVEVFDSPNSPIVDDVTLSAVGSATLTASAGNEVMWYANQNDVVPVFTGLSYTTPVLNSSTSFWVEDVLTHGGIEGAGGKLEQDMGAGNEGIFQTNTQFYLVFDAISPMIIETVKIFTETAGMRNIQVVQNGTVISEVNVMVPEGENNVTLNLSVPEGTGYGLKCNTQNHGFWRDKNLSITSPYDFPYDLSGLATITGTNVSDPNNQDNYYYFFYDWSVSTPSMQCASPRVEVQVIVTGIEELTGINELIAYPNPVLDNLNISFRSNYSGKMDIRVTDNIGRVVQSQNLNTSTGANAYQMDLSKLASGVYQLEFIHNGQNTSTKLIVE